MKKLLAVGVAATLAACLLTPSAHAADWYTLNPQNDRCEHPPAVLGRTPDEANARMRMAGMPAWLQPVFGRDGTVTLVIIHTGNNMGGQMWLPNLRLCERLRAEAIARGMIHGAT